MCVFYLILITDLGYVTWAYGEKFQLVKVTLAPSMIHVINIEIEILKDVITCTAVKYAIPLHEDQTTKLMSLREGKWSPNNKMG